MNDKGEKLERRIGALPEEEFERIAQRAADVLEKRIYEAVGRGIVSKVLWMVGAGLIATAAYFAGREKVNFSIFG